MHILIRIITLSDPGDYSILSKSTSNTTFWFMHFILYALCVASGTAFQFGYGWTRIRLVPWAVGEDSCSELHEKIKESRISGVDVALVYFTPFLLIYRI